ncbi:MAG: M1 family aminopeptidase [Pyrinomonadaceae bacterium]
MKRLSLVAIALIFGFSSYAYSRTPVYQPTYGLAGDDPVLQNLLTAQDEDKSLPPTRYVRSRDFDTKHIGLDLRFDWSTKKTFGVETFVFSPMKSGFKTLKLDAGLMVINGVRYSGGRELSFSYDKEKSLLKIDLDREYARGEEISLEIDYETTGESVDNTLGFGGGGGLKFVEPKGNEPRSRKQVWSQGESEYNRFWFPSYDYPNDFRTTEIKATVPRPMQVISNGVLVEVKNNSDNTRTYHWKMDTPYANYLTSIVVGEFAEVKGSYMDIPISTYVYPDWKFEGQVTAKRLPDMVKFFSETLDFKYPYKKYAQTVGNEFNGGMENISATTQTDTMIHDDRTELDGDQDGLQAHELAHQWFGDFVTCRDWSEIWLNESFATYMEALWQEHSKGKDYFLFNEVRGNQQGYFGAWNQGQRRPIVTKNYANPDAVFDSYAYPRGGAVLHMLRKQLGDENFFKSLNHYLRTNANQPVETEDLRIAIEETTGQSMDAFFDQWLYKMGHPVFEVAKSFDAEKGELKMTVKQTQKVDLTNGYPQVVYFQTPVDIEIVTESGREVETVYLDAKETNEFSFKLASKPLMVDFDNEGTLIKELKFERPNEELFYQAANDDDVLGRFSALSALSAKAGADSAVKEKFLESLRKTAVSDSSPDLRREALGMIQTLLVPRQMAPGTEVSFDEATTKSLLEATKDSSADVRTRAFSLLGLAKNPEHYSYFQRAVMSDKSYNVVSAAARGMGLSGSKEAYVVLRKLAQTDSWGDRLHMAGFIGLAALKDKRALDIAIKYASNENNSSGLRGAALMAVAATGKGDPRAFDLIFGQFKEYLQAGDIQGFVSSLQSIAELGDPRGAEAFTMAKEKYKDSPGFLNFINRIESAFKASTGN